MIHVGFKNFINEEKIVAVVDFTIKSQPILRAINNARDMGMVIDVTMGRLTKTAIFMESGHIVLSHSLTETITERLKEAKQC